MCAWHRDITPLRHRTCCPACKFLILRVTLDGPNRIVVQVSLVGGFVKGGGDTDFKATMIGFDENKDIAVLKIEVPDKKVCAAAGPPNQRQPVILHTCWTFASTNPE